MATCSSARRMSIAITKRWSIRRCCCRTIRAVCWCWVAAMVWPCGRFSSIRQSSAPMFARNSYWCIIRTLEAAGFVVRPYYTAVPSFGLWGFALARSSAFEVPRNPPPGLKFLDDQTLTAMFTLSKDIEPVPVEVNRLDNQILVRYYEGEWKRFE